MRNMRIFAYAALAASAVALSLPAASSFAADGASRPAAVAGAKHKVIFQVSDNDPRKWNLALNNVKNVQQDLGKNNVEIELVAYGPGLPMLKLESEVAGRISDALAQGVKILACENTMTNTKTTRADMLPNLGYVKAGVTTLMARQSEGWAYIRP
ncbi:MAG: DsrE family protein [Sulfuricaulis sp.]|nr:DsrE family protein [Sulfuricaulis sp.]